MLLANLIISGSSTVAIVAEIASKIVKENSRRYIGLKMGGAGLLVLGGVISSKEYLISVLPGLMLALWLYH